MDFSKIVFFIEKIAPFLSGIGTLLLGIAGIKAVKTYRARRLRGKLSGIAIEHEDLRIRELTEGDLDRIVELIRNFSMDTTSALYEAYTGGREKVEKEMYECGLPELVTRFETFNNQTDSTVTGINRLNKFREALKTWDEGDLFCPYGMLQAPFARNTENYIRRAVNTAAENPRDEFRMGVEFRGRLIGCFVFDFIKKTVVNKETIGDFGMFGESAMMTHPGAIYYPVVYFLEGMLPASQKKKIHIGVTLHPCDYIRPPFFAPEYGFEPAGTVEYLYGNSKRNRFTAKYSDFAKTIWPSNKEHSLPRITLNGAAQKGAAVFRFQK